MIHRLFNGKIKRLFIISCMCTSLSLIFVVAAFKFGRVPVILDLSKCKICSDVKNAYGNSQPEDLILLGVFGDISRVFTFVKSLRAVGSLAHVVIISNTTFNEHVRKSLGYCGVEFFTMKSPPNTSRHYPHSLRYIGYMQYLKSTSRTFNRIFHSDAFDVFFQSDPFSEQISPDYLYFVMEDVKIRDSSWNVGWMKRAYNQSIAEAYGSDIVSCSGTIIGGAQQFKIYLKTLLDHKPFWMNGRHSLDQAYHNYLLHSGEFERNGIKRKEFGCNSPFLTLHYCSRWGKYVEKSDGIYCPDGLTKPAVIHQYNINQEAGEYISNHCN